MAHIPVLLKEIIDGLILKPGDVVIDATVNRGGHAKAFAHMVGPTGHVVGVDQDSEALAAARENLTGVSARVTLLHGNFRQLDSLLAKAGLREVDAILYDLGLSSNQLDESGRGFTFKKDEPLHMIMNPDRSRYLFTAKDIVNDWSVTHIADILFGYGEEQFSRQIAAAIVEARKRRPLETTQDLVTIIENAVPIWYRRRRIHPATKSFQALRMAVNDEVDALKEGLEAGWQMLRPGGRMAVISFHSIEARIVKEFFGAKKRSGAGVPYPAHAVKPSRAEEKRNPRSRSATLRFILKLN